jgi:hypothetical protein
VGRIACVPPGENGADLDSHAARIPIGGKVRSGCWIFKGIVARKITFFKAYNDFKTFAAFIG